MVGFRDVMSQQTLEARLKTHLPVRRLDYCAWMEQMMVLGLVIFRHFAFLDDSSHFYLNAQP